MMKFVRLVAAVLAAGLLMSAPSSISIAQQGVQTETPVQVGTTMLTPDQLKAALDKMRADFEQATTDLGTANSKIAELEGVRKDNTREIAAATRTLRCYTDKNVDRQDCLIDVVAEFGDTQVGKAALAELKASRKANNGETLAPKEQGRANIVTTAPTQPGPNFVYGPRYDYGYVETDCPAVKMPQRQAAKQPAKRQPPRVATACPFVQPQR